MTGLRPATARDRDEGRRHLRDYDDRGGGEGRRLLGLLTFARVLTDATRRVPTRPPRDTRLISTSGIYNINTYMYKHVNT